MADEIKQVMEALDRVEGKMDETSKSNAAELKRLGEEQTKLSRQLMELQQKGVVTSRKPKLRRLATTSSMPTASRPSATALPRRLVSNSLKRLTRRKRSLRSRRRPVASFRRTVVRASSLVLSVRSRLKVSSRRSRLPRTLLNTSRKRKPRTSTARHSLLKALRSRLVLPPSRPRRARSRRSLTLLACPSS